MTKTAYLLLCGAFAAASLNAQNVRMYRTTLERDFREVEGAVATTHTGPGAKVIDLDAAKPSHEFLGLGVSFAEASCHLLMKLPAAERRAVLESVFGKTGLGLSIGRIHMGSSDYSRRMYSYDDVPGDMKLEHFSLAPDKAEVIPVIKEAIAVNPDLYFFSSQWSPPGWMKENGTLCGGPLKPDMLGVYTDYFVRFLKAYGEEGVKISAFTVQNEPTANQDYNSPTCIVPPEQEVAVIKMLAPKLKAAGIDAKPWLFDQNFNSTGRVEKCLADAELRSLIGAVAWHPYAGEPEMIAPLKKKYPDLPMYQTEKGPHVDKTQRNLVWWGQLMARSFNAGCGAFCSWCLALDEEGQPNVSCGFPCAGFMEIHSETGAVTPSSQYKAFRHVSPFVKRGAKILDAPLQLGPMVTEWSRKSRPLEGLTVTSFRNPDGSDVVFIAYDQPEKPFGRIQVQIKRNGLYLPVQAFANALTTIVFPANTATEIAMLPGEGWWGLKTGQGREMPFNADSDLTVDLRTSISESCAPLLVSDKGRVVWCEKPLCVTFAKGKMTVDAGGAEVVQVRAGATLREAFKYASQKFFPASGTPDRVFFDAPQLNTWIELTYNQNEKDILAYAESMVKNGVKPGIFMIDDTWQLGYGTWEFDPRRFKDPKGMCDKLNKMGYTLMLWMCPWVSGDTPSYRQLAKYPGMRGTGGFLVDKDGEPFMEKWWNGKSALVDMTHPQGRAWMEGELNRLVKEFGVGGFKLDGGASRHYAWEGEFAYDKTATPPEQSRAWALLTEKFPKSDCCHLWKMGGRPVVTRLHDKNHDWEDLRRIIPDLIACGMVGTPFVCPDMIGGGQYSSFLPGSPFEEELFVRSAQVHACAPMMQFSASPWRLLSPGNQEAVRKTLKIREKFAERIWAQAIDAGKTGEPILRSMEYQFPGNGFSAIKDQFVLGDFLIVAPQLDKGAKSRAVKLPAGNWRDDQGKLYMGPATVTVETPLDRLPYFERER